MPLIRAFWDDVRFAVRRLRQQPGLAAVAILTLAFGLGANTAIFTLIHAVMLRPLPVTRPQELYRLGNNNNCCVNSGLQRDFSLFSYPLFRHLHAELPQFSELAAFQANTIVTGVRPADGGPPFSTPAAYVSGNYFKMLGVIPASGRLIEPGDDDPSAPPVMVISHRTWVERFGAEPAIAGRAFLIGGVAVTLAGITPPEFFGETMRPNPAGIWLPIGQERALRGSTSLTDRPDQHWLYAVGRLARAEDAAAVQAKATAAIQAWLAAQTFLPEPERAQLKDQRIVVTSAATGVQLMRGNFGQSLTLLFAMSGLVLLVAIANLANLLLSRVDRAQAAVRAALGASSSRLVRQSLMEGILLALAGCAGAFVVAILATRGIIALAFPPETNIPVDAMPSLAIVLFSVALAIVTGALFSAAPAWAMARTHPIAALRGLARDGADLSFMPRRSLVIAQVTLSLVLLAGAGLLSKSLSRLEHQPLGFEAEDRLVVRIDPPQLASEPERLAAVYAAMQQRLEQIPGVLRATYALYSPMEGNNWSSIIAVGGRPIDPANREGSSWNRVGPGYFETVGTKLLRGRGITVADTLSSERIAVVSRGFVQRFLADREPIGASLGFGGVERSQDYRIVGVVEDVKYTNAHLPVRAMFFLPMMQRVEDDSPARSMLARAIVLQVAPGRANLEPAIRRALGNVHPELAVTRVMTMDAQISGNFRGNRLLAVLAGSYGLLALALASLGLYGVTAYGVSRRQHEIGVRMALGADRGRIVRSVLRSALIQTGVGLAIGIPLALFVSRALSGQLFDVNARDPGVLAAAAVTLIVTAALAAVVPARRAAAVDPTRALRSQ